MEHARQAWPPCALHRVSHVCAGVFDGHRGPEAAEYAARHFEEHLRRQWAQAATPEQALRCAFVSLDDTFAAQEVRALCLAAQAA